MVFSNCLIDTNIAINIQFINLPGFQVPHMSPVLRLLLLLWFLLVSLQATGVREDQLLVTVLPGLPTTAEFFLLPDKRLKDGNLEQVPKPWLMMTQTSLSPCLCLCESQWLRQFFILLFTHLTSLLHCLAAFFWHDCEHTFLFPPADGSIDLPTYSLFFFLRFLTILLWG